MKKITLEKFIELLEQVEKPQRYLGNELNSVHKDHSETDCSWVFCYPDIYELGMSNLAIKIFYESINSRSDSLCERVFAPWHDLGNLLRKNEIPLFSLESRTPLQDFDFVGITLPHELTFTNILYILDLAEIPFKSSDRDNSHPLIIGGGPASFNPEPLAEIFDMIVIGEGEEIIHELIDKFKEIDKNLPRKDQLEQFLEIPGIYIPSFYKRKTVNGLVIPKPESEVVQGKVKKRFFNKFPDSKSPSKVPVSFTETIHNRAQVEIMRGCSQGCRFCMAGFIYRPVREKNIDNILANSGEIIKNTGFNEVSFSSLNSGFYSEINQLISDSIDTFTSDRISPSLPSLRMDRLEESTLARLTEIRKPGLTFAPEAGSQRLRNIINKKITEKDILETIEKVKKFGWKHLKLYFMLGLPFENRDDIQGIIDLVQKVMEIFGKRSNVTISFSFFIPKPFTPFQWEPLQDKDIILIYKQKLFNELAHFKKLKLNFDYYEQSIVETVISRGDRRIGDLLIKAYNRGCKFDSWKESFNFNSWQDAADKLNLNLLELANKRFDPNRELPWDTIDIGIKKDFLIKEFEKAESESITPSCREGCEDCGVCPIYSNLSFGKEQEHENSIAQKRNNLPDSLAKKFIVFFSKTGLIRFISHNDTLDIIKRTLIRSDLEIKFTEGFNPLPKLTACPALSLGLESKMEAFEFFANKNVTEENIQNRLKMLFPKDLKVIDVKQVTPKLNIRKITGIKYLLITGQPVQAEILTKENEDPDKNMYSFVIPRKNGNFKGPEKFLKENGVPLPERRNFQIIRTQLIFSD